MQIFKNPFFYILLFTVGGFYASYLWRHRIYKKLAGRTGVKFALVVGVTSAAFLAGLIVKDLVTVTRDPAVSDFDRLSAGLIIGIIGIVTIWLTLAKEWLSDEIRHQFKYLQEQLEKVTGQRDALQRMGSHIANIIRAKTKRFKDCEPNGSDRFNVLASALAPDEQVRVIVHSIYEYFKLVWPLAPERQIRFGIYTRGDDPQTLFCWYSTDGANQNCFNQNSERLSLSDADGSKSKIVECFHRTGNHPALIVENTEAGDFDFFRPEQKQYLKSLLVLKYVAEIDGKKAPIIFAVDSDQPGYFREDLEGDYRGFLVEMGRRLEYEIQSLQTIQNLQAA